MDLEGRTQAWVDEGLISPEQRQEILDREGGGEPRHLKAASVVSVMGALLVGVAALVFVATQWGELSPWSRAVILVGSWLALHLTAWFVPSDRIGHALHFAGSGLFGASLMLLGQTFNLPAETPTLLLLWLLGVAPLAYILPSLPHMVGSLGLASVWLGFQAGEWGQLDLLDVGHAFVLFAALGLTFVALARLHRDRSIEAGSSHLPDLFATPGLVYLLVPSYALTFEEVPEWFEPLASWQPTLLLALLTLPALGYLGLRWWRQRGSWLPVWCMSLLVVSSLPWAVPALAHPALWNVVLFLAILSLVFIAVADEDNVTLVLGLIAFLIMVFTRYFQFFWDVLNRSVLFLVAGLLLLGLAWGLERFRRGVVS